MMIEPRIVKTKVGPTLILLDYIQTIGANSHINDERLKETMIKFKLITKELPPIEWFKRD